MNFGIWYSIIKGAMVMKWTLTIRWVMASAVVLMAGCAALRSPEPVPVVPEPEPERAPPEVATPKPALSEAQSAEVAQLLAQAETALTRGRLIPPQRDNAYGLLRAALAIDPHNIEARAALDGVLLAYMDQIRITMRRGGLREAQNMVDRGEDLFPRAQLFSGLRIELNRAVQEHQAEQLALLEAADIEGERVVLSVAELNQRSEALQEQLGELAERLVRTQESVMIWARNDAEGRWIYQTMQARVTGYRIRGDIRLSSRPFLQPLEPL